MPRDPADIPDAALRLALAPMAGPALHHALLAAHGSAEAAVDALRRDGAAAIPPLPWLAAGRAQALADAVAAVDADAERTAMAGIGLRAIVLGDDDYPPLLSPVPLPPILLWVRGDPGACARDAVAVVGARRATAYGEGQAARFAGAFAAAGLAVVSGGARGIDAAAHRAALRAGGATVAVLGAGLGEPYPPEHVGLFESIVEGGGLLLSEFPTRFPPLAANFPRRNRIISGLSLTVVVVEAGLASGALVTARHAIDDHQREPCAVPGPVDSPRSAGCNAAIRDGWAQCVLDPGDVLAMVEASAERLGGRAAAATSGDRLEALGVPPALRDAVSRAAGLLARRPRMGDAELAADLGMPPSAVAAVRTFASLAAAPGQVQPMA